MHALYSSSMPRASVPRSVYMPMYRDSTRVVREWHTYTDLHHSVATYEYRRRSNSYVGSYWRSSLVSTATVAPDRRVTSNCLGIPTVYPFTDSLVTSSPAQDHVGLTTSAATGAAS